MTTRHAGHSHSWWWQGHISPKNSQWLEDSLKEMDDKVKHMLNLIETDADSFAKRAEMYYEKRPELVHLVEEFYRSYRSVAERYNNLTGEIRQNFPQALQGEHGVTGDAAAGSPSSQKARKRAAGFDVFLKSSKPDKPHGAYTGEDSSHKGARQSIKGKDSSSSSSDSCSSSESDSKSHDRPGKKLQQLREENKELKEESRKCIELFNAAEKRSNEAQEAFIQLREEKKRVEDELNREISQLRQEMAFKTEEEESFRGMLETSSLELGQLKLEIQELHHLLNNSQEENRIMANELQAKTESYEFARKEIDKVHEEIDELQRTNVRLNDEISSMTMYSNGLEDSISNLEKENKFQKDEMLAVTEQTRNLQDDSSKYVKTLEIQENELQELRKEIQIVQQSLCDAQQENARQTDECQGYKEHYDSIEEQKVEMESALSFYKEENFRLQEKVMILEEGTNKLSTESEGMSVQLFAAQEKSGQLHESLVYLEEENRKLNEKLSDSFTQIREIEEDRLLWYREKSDFSGQVELLGKEVDRLQEEICHLRQEETQLRMVGDEERHSVEIKIQNLEQAILVSQQASDERSMQLQERILHLEEEKGWLEDQLSGSHRKIESLEEEESSLLKEKLVLGDQVTFHDQVNRQLQEMIDRMTQEVNEQKRRLDDAAEEKQKMGLEMQEQLLNYQQNNEERCKQLREEILQLRQECSKLQGELSRNHACLRFFEEVKLIRSQLISGLKAETYKLRRQKEECGREVQYHIDQLLGSQSQQCALSGTQGNDNSKDECLLDIGKHRSGANKLLELDGIPSFQDTDFKVETEQEIEVLGQLQRALQELNSKLPAEFEQIMLQLKAAEERHSQLHKEALSSEEEKTRLDNELSINSTYTKELEAKMLSLQHEIDDLNGHAISNFVQQIDVLHDENENLKNQLELKLMLEQKLETDIQYLQQQLLNSDEENKNLNSEYENVVEKYQALDKRVVEVEIEALDKVEQAHQMQDEIEGLKLLLDRCQEENKELILEHESCRIQCEAIQEQGKQAEGELKKLQEEIVKLEASLSTGTTLARNFEEESAMENEKDKVSDWPMLQNEHMKMLQYRIQCMHGEHEELHRRLQARVEQEHKLEWDIQKLQETLTSSECENRFIKDECKMHTEDILYLQRENQTLSEKFQTEVDQEEKLNFEYQKLQSDFLAVQQECQNTKDECNRYKEELSYLQNEIETFQDEMQRKGVHIEEMEKVVCCFEKERIDLESLLTLGQEQMSVLEEKMGSLQQENEDLRMKVQLGCQQIQALEEDMQKLQQLHLKLQDEHESLKQESQRGLSGSALLEKRLMEMQEEFSLQQAENSGLKIEILNGTKRIQELEQKVEYLEQEKQVLAVEIAAGSKNITDLQEKQALLQEEGEQLERKLKIDIQQVQMKEMEIENLHVLLTQHQEQRKNALDELERTIKYCDDVVETSNKLQEQVAFLQKQNGSLYEEVQIRDARIEILENDIVSLQVEKTAVDDIMASTLQQIQVLQEELTRTQKSQELAETDLKTQQGNAKELEEKAQELQQLLFSSQQESTQVIEKLQVEVKNLQVALTGLQDHTESLKQDHAVELEKHSHINASLEEEGQLLHERLKNLQEENDMLHNEVSVNVDCRNKLEEMLASLKEQRVVFEGQFSLTIDQVSQIQTEVTKLVKEHRRLSIKSQSADQQMKKLEDDISLFHIQNEKFLEQISAAARKEKSFITVLRFMRAETSFLLQKVKELRSELLLTEDQKQRVDLVLILKEQELLKLEDDNQKIKADFEGLVTGNERKLRDLNTNLTNLQREITSLQEENKRQRTIIFDRAEEKREAIRQLCFSLDLLQEKNRHLEMILNSYRSRFKAGRKNTSAKRS